ncbi:MAG: methionine--tRNA ligase [Clostridiales bacterium]|nr:MAG: methionine--tRNA ligase [Clostridiales bacterium]
MSDKNTFYITTAIMYASQKPHIGNTYEAIMADAIARYKRLRGFDVFFMTGTDEHGQKIEDYAKKEGLTPKEYVDKVAGQIKEIWDMVGTSYDKFIRTTDDYHEKAVANMFKRMYEKGDIYKGEYEGHYCVPCESFFTETQLVDGKCPDCGSEVKKAKEEAYFFKMSKYQDRLMKYIEENPDFITPESRKKEMVNNFLKPGLQDLCVSRTSFKWGIPVEFDPKHVVYVWLDALSNYITGLGYDVDKQGEDYAKYWPADVHIIGKDILRFHTIYWPIFLMSLDLPLPKMVFGHPWLLFGEDKMSKSKGNVIYPDELVNEFGVDATRHYVLSEMPYGSDGSITYESVISRYNSDLANNLGNLVSRTMAMTEKYFDGIIPDPVGKTEFDEDIKKTVALSIEKYTERMDTYHIADASDIVFAMLRRANKYIDETTPWTLAKDENRKGDLATVIYILLETIRTGAVMLMPFMPKTCERIFSQLGTEQSDFDSIKEFGGLKSGTHIGKAEILFGRIDEDVKLKEMIALAESKKKPQKPEGIAQIGIEEFMNVELRTALVYECESVPKSDKLLKLQLDLGYEKRQVVSGIAKFYKPEDLIGKKIIVVANLKPVKLRGVESNGMIIASGEETVRVVFLDKDTPLGERVR